MSKKKKRPLYIFNIPLCVYILAICLLNQCLGFLWHKFGIVVMQNFIFEGLNTMLILHQKRKKKKRTHQ